MEQVIEFILDVFKDIVSSLVYAVMAFIVVWIYDIISKAVFKHNFYKLTRLNIEKDDDIHKIKCYIANSGRYDENEKVYLGYPFEYMSSASLNSYLNMLSLSVELETFTCPLLKSELGEIDKTKDIILLGGPFHNMLTKHFFGLAKDNTNLPLYFDIYEDEEATLFYKNENEEEYKTAKPTKDPIGEYYNEDYGLIINIKNPYNPSKRIIALIGCRSIGVLGAAYAFTTYNQKLLGNIKHDEYAAIIKCYGDRNNVDVERDIEFITSIKLNSLTKEQLITVKDRNKISI